MNRPFNVSPARTSSMRLTAAFASRLRKTYGYPDLRRDSWRKCCRLRTIWHPNPELHQGGNRLDESFGPCVNCPFGNVTDADRYVTGGLNQRVARPLARETALHHRTLIDHDLTDAQLVNVCPFVMLSVCDRRLEDFANHASCFSWTELQQLRAFAHG